MAITATQGVPGAGMSLALSPSAAVSRNPRTVTAPVGRLQSGGTLHPSCVNPSACAAFEACGVGCLQVATTYEKVEHMADLWMPAAVVEQASVDHMNHLCRLAFRRSTRHAESLHQARCAVMDRLRATVGHIRDRGCLLHVNAPFFGGAK